MTTRRKPLPQATRVATGQLDVSTSHQRSLSPSKSLPVLYPHQTYVECNDGRDQIYGVQDLSLEDHDQSSVSYVQSPTVLTASEYGAADEQWSSTLHQTEMVSQRLDSNASSIPTASDSFDLDDDPSPGMLTQTENAGSSKAKLRLVTALEETSIFLGGLIKHPVESNRHFTILRHSHGLVYYKGPGTSIAISIFSDQPIPVFRRYWLQSKGWTGNTGMAAKAFFRANNNWINVTPDVQAVASELPALDERAWQRDIKKFAGKANKTQRRHVLRETAVVRIPFEANDGYFRIVLTGSDSRQVLCPSPVFRIASTSMSAGSLKGASLSKIPVELGAKIAQFAAKTTISTTVAPLATTVSNQITSVVPLAQYSGYTKTAWDASNMSNRVGNIDQKYLKREMQAEQEKQLYTTRTNATGSSSIGSEDGPEDPFPVQINGIVTQGSGETAITLGTPTANLDSIPPDLLAFLGVGHYFGWAFVLPRDKNEREIHLDWRQAVITILHRSSSVPSVAPRKVARVYLIHDFRPDTSFIGAKMKVVILGYLRPLTIGSNSIDRELALVETVNDVAVTQASLSRPAWGHEETLRRVKTAKSSRSASDRLVDLRTTGQRQIDRVPVHMLGVRSNTFGVHDRGMYGNGGLWVKRD